MDRECTCHIDVDSCLYSYNDKSRFGAKVKVLDFTIPHQWKYCPDSVKQLLLDIEDFNDDDL